MQDCIGLEWNNGLVAKKPVYAGKVVSEVRVNSNELTVTLWESGERFRTLGVVDDELTRKLSEQGVVLSWGEEPRPLVTLLTWALPLVLVLVFSGYGASAAQRAVQGVLALTRLTKAFGDVLSYLYICSAMLRSVVGWRAKANGPSTNGSTHG